jgi:hypothetical protein
MGEPHACGGGVCHDTSLPQPSSQRPAGGKEQAEKGEKGRGEVCRDENVILGLGNCELDASSRHGRYLAGSLLQAHHGRVLSLCGQDVFYSAQRLAQL